jgi:transcriptional regulator with XRE-family HTH domain
MTTHTNVPALADLRRRLATKDSRSVSAASGIHFTTIAAIAKGRNLNPTLGTLSAISDALDAMEGNEHE